MNEHKNTLGMILLVVILLTFIIGGYLAMRYLTQEKKVENESSKPTEVKKDLRLDKSKDYIYYDNEEEVIASQEIEFMDVHFNLESMQEVNGRLKSEMDSMRKSIKYTKDVSDIPEDAETNEEGIYSLEFRDYNDFFSPDYISLLVMDYTYDIVNGPNPTSIESYVVEKATGRRILGDELLKSYNLTMDEVKTKVQKRVSDTQTLDNDIDVEGTMNNFNIFALYINKLGDLEITFVVKSSAGNYNDSIVLND